MYLFCLSVQFVTYSTLTGGMADEHNPAPGTALQVREDLHVYDQPEAHIVLASGQLAFSQTVQSGALRQPAQVATL